MSSFDKEGLYFIALGGAEEVGYNMYVYAADGKLIVVDCGYGFFNDDFPGMELGFGRNWNVRSMQRRLPPRISSPGLRTISLKKSRRLTSSMTAKP